MTSSSDHGRSRRRPGGSQREPATLDMTAQDVTAPTGDAGDDGPVEPVAYPPVGGSGDEIASASSSERAGDGSAAAASAIEENSAGETVPEAHTPDALAAGGAAATGLGSTAAGGGEPPSSDPGGRRGLGFGSLLAAGLLGGAVGAGATALTQPWWGRAGGSEISARLAQIETRANAAAPRDAVAPLEQRLAALESGQKQVAEQARSAQALAEGSAARAAEALNRPAPAAELPQPAQERLAALEAEVQALKAAPAPAPEGRIEALAADLKTLAADVRTLKDAPPAAPESRVADLQAAVASLQQSVQAAQQTQQSRLAALETELRGQREAAQAAAERRAAEQQQRLTGLTEQVSAQDQRLATLAKTVAERTQAPLAESLRIVAADRVGDALSEGRPYADALATLRRGGVDAKKLAPLEPFAASGAPGAAALAQEFEPLADKIQASLRGEASDWTDRLRRMANQVVAVRPVGEADGSSAAGLVARIEAALARGALRDAASTWDSLPESARKMSAAWGEKLKARIAAEDAARGLAAEALAALEAAAR